MWQVRGRGDLDLTCKAWRSPLECVLIGQSVDCQLPSPMCILATQTALLSCPRFSFAEQRQAHGGPLPLSPGSTLGWLGFSEEGLLAAYDSVGELRLRSELFGGAWVTAFSAAAGE